MKKIGLVVDSTSGLSRKEVESKGYGFFPLIITINGKEYKSGDEINTKELYKKMTDRNVEIKTSLPKGNDIINAFDKVLENYDKAVYIGMSHKFSGTNNAARLIASDKKYKNKIIVFEETEFSSPWEKFYINEIINMIDDFKNTNELFNLLKKTNPLMNGYLSPGDIWWFYKGGRISKSQYIIGNLSKIFPILKITKGKIDNNLTIKIRNKKNAILKMCNLVKEDYKKVVKMGFKPKIIILDSDDKDLVEKISNTIVEEFGVKKNEIIKTHLCPEQTAHLGPGSFGVTLYIELKQIKEKIK